MTPPTDAAVLGGITAESKEYFEKRSLKKGAVNWVLLMSLGIAYVISGDFSGWNYGIGYGGCSECLSHSWSWEPCTCSWC